MFRTISHLIPLLWLAAVLGCESPSEAPGHEDPTTPGGLIPNALRDYVQANFEGNGGSIYPHLKLYANLFRAELSDSEKVWLASHYDMVDHGSWDFPERARQINPQIVTLTHFNIAYNNREVIPSALESWVTSEENVQGLELTDLLINYGSNAQNRCGTFSPGDLLPQGKRCHWYTADSASTAWRSWGVDALVSSLQMGTVNERDGAMLDDVTFANDGMSWDLTEEYPGIDPSSEDHPRIAELYSTAGYLKDQMEGGPAPGKIWVANIGSTWWLTSPGTEGRKALAQTYCPNIQDETWAMVNPPAQAPKNWQSHYQGSVVSPIVDFLRKGYGYIFETGDYADTDRGRRFTLGMFYLVNHPLAYYWYRHIGSSNLDLEAYMWNPYVEVDIGQPMVNQQGIQDFEGETSNEHYIMEEGETYHLLAREYAQALVVVKLMHRYETPGQNAATHQLPRSYRVLQPDLTVGPEVTEVSLANNDAVILMKN